MTRVRLVHWNAAEAEERADKLRALGYEVENAPLGPAELRRLKQDRPDAVVIDLSRLPSQGRDLAMGLRGVKKTRQLPLVFVDGSPEKIERVKQSLPDAAYTTWGRIRGTLRRALASPPKDPVVPRSQLDGYAGTPLPRKLGIKDGSVVVLVGAPMNFEETLGALPPRVVLRRRSRGPCDLVIWFTRSRLEVERGVKKMGALAGKHGLWIVWPKKASGLAADLTQNDVRRIGLASDLVDYKICAVDATWSGLRFARRKPKRSAP